MARECCRGGAVVDDQAHHVIRHRYAHQAQGAGLIGSDREAGAALGTTPRENLAAIGGFHALTETVVALALDIAGLISAFGGHNETPN